MNADFIRKLPTPAELKERMPLARSAAEAFTRRANEIARVIRGADDRLLLIIGPCSADSEQPVLDYVDRLARLEEQVEDTFVIVPRVYASKPRTLGIGYKGMLHQPDPRREPDIFNGIIAMRRLHMRCLEETGLCSADEMLYCAEYKYVDDLLGYVTVGARSVEDQEHRLTASAVGVPVGMKNPLGGNTTAMLNAIVAAQTPQDFIYRGWECRSKGNPLCHAVLRGYVGSDGIDHRNCSAEELRELARKYAASAARNPACVIDCSHSNSGKDPFAQGAVAKSVLRDVRDDAVCRSLVRGFMVESYLEDGTQPVGGSVYGQSITDPCLGWEKTYRLILELADLVP